MKSSTVWRKVSLLLCVIILCCFRHGDTECDKFAQCEHTHPDDNVQCSVEKQGNSAGSCHGIGSMLHSCHCNGEGLTLNLTKSNGRNSFRCTRSATWDEGFSELSCTAKTCDAPVLWDNSLVRIPDQTSYANGTEVTFRCVEGFELSGDTLSVVCNYGNWSSYQYPNCTVRNCSRPIFSDKYVRVSPDQESYANGSEVNFECPGCFNLSAKEISTVCLHGIWESYTEPNCTTKMCANPNRDDTNVILDPQGDFYSNGSEVYFTCPGGYYINGSNEGVCLCGVWTLSQGNPKCNAKTCDAPVLWDNFLVRIPDQTSYANGTEVTFRCVEEFELSGDTLSVVCNYGNWSSYQYPNCTVRNCSRPIFSDKHVRVSPDQESYVNGSEVNFKCSRGFHLNKGKISTICLYGSWGSYKEPKCRIRNCSRPIFSDKHVRVSPDQESYVSGSEVNFKCSRGFHLNKGKNSAICLYGSWGSYTEPKCRNWPRILLWVICVVLIAVLIWLAYFYIKSHYHRTGSMLVKTEPTLEVPSDNQQTYISKLNFEMSDPKDGYKNEYSSTSPKDNNEAIADLTNDYTLPSTV